ncbi:hypothetical protein N0V88_007456 [Collariella sp. IMI 366227]|nr:hypothetical protein N0V88_007456 [Collariella sp. IMI 366227]
MFFKHFLVATILAAASLVLALPTPYVVDLSVRNDEDYGDGYKRSPVEIFVCKRDDNQSLSCLRKKSDNSDAQTVDQSKTANI